MITAIMYQRVASTVQDNAIDPSEIHYDERGLARWTKNGISLLTPSDIDPGPRPVTSAGNWANWDDRNYAWELANERFHLPKGYEPPAIYSGDLTASAHPVVTSTAAQVAANALLDRRAAGIADTDGFSIGTVATGSSVNVNRVPDDVTSTLNVNRTTLIDGVLTENGVPIEQVKYNQDGTVKMGAQLLPENNTTVPALNPKMILYVMLALAAVVVAYKVYKRA